MDSDVDAVFLDLDDTLCTFPRSTADLLAEAFERTGVGPFFTAREFHDRIPEVTADSALDLREQCFRLLADERDRSHALAERVAANYPERNPADVHLLPGAAAALDALSERYPLGLVSNGAPGTQRAKLATLDLDPYFDVTVFGTPETGVKPDPAPFHRALDALDVAPDRAVHVGNSLAADVAGADAAGVRTVWVRREDAEQDAAGPMPNHAVDALAAFHDDPLPWHPSTPDSPP